MSYSYQHYVLIPQELTTNRAIILRSDGSAASRVFPEVKAETIGLILIRRISIGSQSRYCRDDEGSDCCAQLMNRLHRPIHNM